MMMKMMMMTMKMTSLMEVMRMRTILREEKTHPHLERPAKKWREKREERGGQGEFHMTIHPMIEYAFYDFLQVRYNINLVPSRPPFFIIHCSSPSLSHHSLSHHSLIRPLFTISCC